MTTCLTCTATIPTRTTGGGRQKEYCVDCLQQRNRDKALEWYYRNNIKTRRRQVAAPAPARITGGGNLSEYGIKNLCAAVVSRAALDAKYEPTPFHYWAVLFMETVGKDALPSRRHADRHAAYTRLREGACRTKQLTKHKLDAIEWLTSQDAEVYYDVLNIHPDTVRGWMQNEMEVLV